MIKINVTREYVVQVAQEDLDSVAELDLSTGDLIDSITRACDMGHTSGEIYLVREIDGEGELFWDHDDEESEPILTIKYYVDEVDVVI